MRISRGVCLRGRECLCDARKQVRAILIRGATPFQHGRRDWLLATALQQRVVRWATGENQVSRAQACRRAVVATSVTHIDALIGSTSLIHCVSTAPLHKAGRGQP